MSSRGPGATRPPEAPAAGSALLYVDAVEAQVARLLLPGGKPFEVPARLLPPGAKEGSWLRASFVLAEPPPDETAAIRERLGRGDDGGDIKL